MARSLGRGSQSLSPRQQQILGMLDLFCNGFDLEELYEVFHSYEMHEILDLSARCRRDSIVLSPSVRSSLHSTISSIFSSRDSCASMDSYMTSSSTAHSAAEQPSTKPKNHEFDASNHIQHLHELHNSSPANQAPPHSHIERPRYLAQHFCITCRKCYTDGNGLSRHRREKCESRGNWVCRHCPPQSKASFERLDRLKDHQKREHSAKTIVDFDVALQRHPPKQAWGCPCCIACFNSLEKWHEHESSHDSDVLWDGQSVDVDIEHWSFTTLVSSLLLASKSLSPAAAKYDWRSCSWSSKTEFWSKVKFALERHEIPREVWGHPEYASLFTAESIVLYVYNIGKNGSPFSQRRPAPSSQHRPAPSSLYGSASAATSVLELSSRSEQSFTSRARRSKTATPQPIYPLDSDAPLAHTTQTQHESQSTNFAMATSHGGDQLYLSSLDRIYPYTNSVQMEKIPLRSSNPTAAQESTLLVEQDETFQRGRTRQLSDSSIVLEPKRPKLHRSRTRSIRDLIARPGSSLGKVSIADAPPLPSPTIREATLSALNSIHTADVQLQRHDTSTRSVTPSGNQMYRGSQSTSVNMSPKRLPLRASQTPVFPFEDFNDDWSQSTGLEPLFDLP